MVDLKGVVGAADFAFVLGFAPDLFDGRAANSFRRRRFEVLESHIEEEIKEFEVRKLRVLVGEQAFDFFCFFSHL